MTLMLRIKELRIQKGLTRKELAKKADISISWLKHIENGENLPSIRTLAKIAEALEVPIKDIFSD